MTATSPSAARTRRAAIVSPVVDTLAVSGLALLAFIPLLLTGRSYSFFKTQRRGRHTIKFCLGTACYVGGVPQLVEKAKQMLNIELGQTTPDGMITLEECRSWEPAARRRWSSSTRKCRDGCAPTSSRSSSRRSRAERMREIALHLLDIAENSAAADSRNISIVVHEDLYRDVLSAYVSDDGRGMDA